MSAASSARRWASPTPAASPSVEIQFCDYAFNIIDMLKIAGNQRWASGGGFDMPIVVDDAHGRGHPRQSLPFALLRELGQPAAGLEGRDAVQRRSTPTD